MTDRARFDLLNTLINKMNAGKIATEREIKKAITPEEWEQYLSEKSKPSPIPEMPPHIKAVLARYNSLIRQADRYFDTVENSSSTKRKYSRNRPPSYNCPYFKAEKLYCKGLEVLEELFSEGGGTFVWLDRPVSFDHGSATSPDQVSVPRLVTSRSPHALREGKKKRSNRSLRLETLLNSRTELMAQGQFNGQEDLEATGVRMLKLDWKRDENRTENPATAAEAIAQFYKDFNNRFD